METVTKEIQVYTIEELKNVNKKAYNRILDKAREKVGGTIDFYYQEALEELTKVFDRSYFSFKLHDRYGGFFTRVTPDKHSEEDKEYLEEYQNELLEDLKNVCSQNSLLYNFFTVYKREDFDTFNEFVAEIFACLSIRTHNKKVHYYYYDKNIIEYMKEFDGETLYTIDGVNINEL